METPIFWFENYADLRRAHEALAKAHGVGKVSYANGAERIQFKDWSEYLFRVKTRATA